DGEVIAERFERAQARRSEIEAAAGRRRRPEVLPDADRGTARGAVHHLDADQPYRTPCRRRRLRRHHRVEHRERDRRAQAAQHRAPRQRFHLRAFSRSALHDTVPGGPFNVPSIVPSSFTVPAISIDAWSPPPSTAPDSVSATPASSPFSWISRRSPLRWVGRRMTPLTAVPFCSSVRATGTTCPPCSPMFHVPVTFGVSAVRAVARADGKDARSSATTNTAGIRVMGAG